MEGDGGGLEEGWRGTRGGLEEGWRRTGGDWRRDGESGARNGSVNHRVFSIMPPQMTASSISTSST